MLIRLCQRSPTHRHAQVRHRLPHRTKTPHPTFRTPSINSPIQRHYKVAMSEAFQRPTRSLEGRVAIVSGAGAAGDGVGNGRASAILLAEAGCNVVCVDMKQELAERTAEMIQKDGKAKAIVADDCENAVQAAVKEWGRLDIRERSQIIKIDC